MRSLIISIILLCLLMAGQAQADETMEDAMARWVSIQCDTPINVNSVAHVGEVNDWQYFYIMYNDVCQYTHGETHVWKARTDMLKEAVK